MRVTEQTKALAQEILDYWVAYPERHDQKHWVNVDGDESSGARVTEKTLCRTTMCVAGTAALLGLGVKDFASFRASGRKYSEMGRELLGLTRDEADTLFYCMDNEAAKNGVTAIAAGDEVKFWEVLADEPD